MYKHNYKTKYDLIYAGFKFNHFFDGYALRFPVWKWKFKPVLEAIATIHENGNELEREVKIDVVSADTNNYYFPFYIKDEVHKDMINTIYERIDKKLDSIGIKCIHK